MEKITNLFKKKKMNNLLDPTSFRLILDCLNKGGRLQIKKNNSMSWYNVKNFDLSQQLPYFTIENGNSFEIVDL